MSVAKPPKNRDALATLRIPRRDETRKRPVLRRFRWPLLLLLLAALGYGSFVVGQPNGWLNGMTELVPEAIRSLPEVRISKAVVQQGRSADALVVATGYLESRRQAMIGARAAGRIEVINVEEGSRVTEGEIIAVLEHRDIDAALAATKATLARAEAELNEQQVEISRTKTVFDRSETLKKTRSLSDADYDQAKFEYQAAVARRDSLEAAVDLARARVTESEQFKQNMIIRAPFDGTVISKDAEVGESILPGGMGEASGRGSVVTIADLEHLEVDCDVKENYIGRISPGSPAEVAVDAVPDQRYQGEVRKIIPMGDRARATIKVKVEILDADERLFPEMGATVYFLPESQDVAVNDEEPRVFCNSDAVQSRGEEEVVWLLNPENRAERIAITAGEQRDGRTEILTGLRGGERLILNPPDDIHEGMSLRVRE